MTYAVSVYRSSVLIAEIEADPKTAWRAAQTYVRSFAHHEGCTDAPKWEQPRGRVSFEIGPFRAINAVRHDR